MKIIDCIKTILPLAKIIKIGILPGEKIHEMLIHSETKNIFDCGKYYTILPEFKFWTKKKYKINGKKINQNFEYSSNGNKFWIKGNELAKKIL
jgi:FlaA1/EpsC-like NDP-sugar epimerase